MRLTQVLPVVLASATVVVGAPTDKHRLIKRDPGCLRRGGVWTACLAVQALQVQIGGFPIKFNECGALYDAFQSCDPQAAPPPPAINLQPGTTIQVVQAGENGETKVLKNGQPVEVDPERSDTTPGESWNVPTLEPGENPSSLKSDDERSILNNQYQALTPETKKKSKNDFWGGLGAALEKIATEKTLADASVVETPSDYYDTGNSYAYGDYRAASGATNTAPSNIRALEFKPIGMSN